VVLERIQSSEWPGNSGVNAERRKAERVLSDGFVSLGGGCSTSQQRRHRREDVSGSQLRTPRRIAKLQPFVAEIRETIGEPDYLAQLETLVMKADNVEKKLENRRRLIERWSHAKAASN
jgi:hypothetical protein